MTRFALSFASILIAAGIGINGYADDTDALKNEKPTVHQEATTDVGPILEKLDENKDSYIGKEEAGQLEGLSQAFDAADANKDGMLDAAELSKFLAPTTN